MAAQRGILGVKKDPKNQILFSFQAREGEEWPDDDSEDSDFDPTPTEMKREGIILTIKKSRITKRHSHKKKHKDDASPKKKHKGASPKKKHKDDASPKKKHKGDAFTKKKRKDDVPPKGEHEEEVSPKRVKFLEDEAQCERWPELPPELLLKIFQCVTDEQGALPFLPRISKVCMQWAEVARHPALWSHVDLSYGWIKSEDRTLIKLCPLRLSRAKEINLSSWGNLTDVGLEAIADNCPLLESIDISNCCKIKGVAIQNLLTKCTKLSKLNISNVHTDVVKPQTLKNILEKCGQSLKSLEMSRNKLTAFNTVLSILQNGSSPGAHCRKLEVLDISNCWFSTDFMSLNLEKLQEGLPNLSVLRLANSKLKASSASGRVQAEAPGFPKLKELSVAVSTTSANGGIGIDDSFIARMLKTSLELRLLDLRGTSHVTLRGLQALPITDLEQLYLAQSAVARQTGLEVVMHKWRHSLRVLDLSWNIFPDDDFEVALEALAGLPEDSQLEVLHLSGTSISGPQVKVLLTGCPRLTTLTLSSCRGLPRGMKRDYTGKELDELRENIDEILES